MMIGSTIGQYRIEDKLGAGGMGEVYRALDTMLEREVALKVLHRFATQDAGWLERFRSEAVTLARLNHPNIAILHNFFEVGQDYYMVMEYVEGATFEELLRREEKVPLRTALEWFCQALRGFEHAHARNVIHRDIKPANLMLNGEGVVKITDFGIARVMGGQHLTKTGKLIGTLEYMSPEQVRGQEQDARSDIYSLGILLHELATQKVPFTGTSDYEIMRSHLELAPSPPRELNGDLPPEIEAAILKALSKKPSERFQTASEFRAAIEPALARLPAEKFAIPLPVKSTREAPAVSPSSPLAPVDAPETALAGGLGEIKSETRVGSSAAGSSAAGSSAVGVVEKPARQWPPPWLSPQIALGAALTFLVAMLFIAMASRGGTGATTTTNTIADTTMRAPVTESLSSEPTSVPTVSIEEKNETGSPSYGGAIPFSGAPDPAITPLPTEKPTPTAKPTEKPTPRPTARPKPKPVVRRKSQPTVKKSTVRRTTPKRSTPKRSTPRKSRPSGGSGGKSVIDIIKNS